MTITSQQIHRTHVGLTGILAGEPELAGLPLYPPCSNILFNTIPPCPQRQEQVQQLRKRKAHSMGGTSRETTPSPSCFVLVFPTFSMYGYYHCE